MNSYNDNLHTSVINSLNTQEVELKKISASRNSAMFSLYYAEGARITADEKLSLTWERYREQQEVHNTAVENNNISINLMDAAAQGNTYTAQGINNIAVGAVNVQVAANAILKLASDVGSIYSIAKAADFDTQIHQQAKLVNERMGDTAYDAELASQYAMEASNLMAQVSASTVLSQAKSTGATMQTFLGTVTAQFNATSTEVDADNQAVAKASDLEKKAEGVLEDINVEYFATQGAYNLTNKELNLNLIVPMIDTVENPLETNTSFTVEFSPLQSAFPPTGMSKVGYPVDQYYIFVTKDQRKSTFSIASAEGLIEEGKTDQFITIDPTDIKNGKFVKEISSFNIKDTDDDTIELGDDYNVFVYAALSNTYKTQLNNFENYLSAPSASFNLQNKLYAPAHADIKVKRTEDGAANEKEITFTVAQNKDYEVEYRIMLLPDNRRLVQGLLTAEGLRTLEEEVEKLEMIADKYDPKIAEDEAKINTLEATKGSLDAEVTAVLEELGNADSDETVKLEKQLQALKDKRSDTQKQLAKLKKELKQLKKAKAKAESTLQPNAQSKPGFFFNLLLAEQVPAGAYIVPTKEQITVEDNGEDNMRTVSIKVPILADSSDNFGNRLMHNGKYIPAVLAISAENEDISDQFQNALSDFAKTAVFTYKS